MFEVYRMNDDAARRAEPDAELCDRLRAIAPEYDLVVVADYGHGMLSTKAIDILSKHARFLAVNTQSNAGNHGFNMISKYPRADYVCLAQREVALETRNQQLTDEEMAEHVSAKARLPAGDDHPRQRRDALPHRARTASPRSGTGHADRRPRRRR